MRQATADTHRSSRFRFVTLTPPATVAASATGRKEVSVTAPLYGASLVPGSPA
jgi:hypothetical protein